MVSSSATLSNIQQIICHVMKTMPPLNDFLRLNLKICLLFLISRCFADLRHGYSMLQYGHKLDRRMITSYDGYSILDCVEDCLRTTRCRSVNYHQGAHFCQINFKSSISTPAQYIEKPGWIYSNIEDWDRDIAGACSTSNCALNEKCIPKPFGEHDCVLSDCGIPLGEGFSLDNVREWDAIGITSGFHITCSSEYQQEGSERFVCLYNGHWKTNLNCTLKACHVGYTEVLSNSTRVCLRFAAERTYYWVAKLDCSADGGDLLRIDTPDIRLAFLHFVKDSETNDIWIQDKKDDGVWKFHDDTNMPDFLKEYMYETNGQGEVRLRYVISVDKFLDTRPDRDLGYSSVCQYRFD